MSLNIDELKNKIIYRSRYRGSKEMDSLMKSFVNNIIDGLDIDDLEKLLNLLEIDDINLYNYKYGYKTEAQIFENRITKLFKDFTYKK